MRTLYNVKVYLSMEFLKNHNPKFDASLDFSGDCTLSVGSIGDSSLEIAATLENVTLSDSASVKVVSAAANPAQLSVL